MASHQPIADSAFEEGEIEGNEVYVVGGQAMDVDALDFQGWSAEEGEFVEDTKGASQRPRHEKQKRKRSGKRAKTVNVARFVREACTRLQEKKFSLVWAAVKSLGVDSVSDLLKEVDAIEKCGGQFTQDGKRRRTPGGVMWNILRDRVQPEVYKEIMSHGNEVKRQNSQKLQDSKESLKRSRMDVDEPVNNKRQKLNANFSNAGKKRRNWSRSVPRLLDVTDGPPRDDSSQSAIQLQRAWAEGIRKRVDLDAPPVVSNSLPGLDAGILRTGSVTSVRPEKKSVPVHERLRMPVEYGDVGT